MPVNKQKEKKISANTIKPSTNKSKRPERPERPKRPKKTTQNVPKKNKSKTRGGANGDNFGMYASMKDISNLRDLNFNKPFKYDDIVPLSGVPLSNFALY
jgi:hypothetical protein